MNKNLLNNAVIVGSLGYFVDVFDLFLFNVLRLPSLIALGVPSERLFATSVLLLNSQMAGLLIGGVCFGVLGDRYGRKKVLLGSIFIYSLATFLNGMISAIPLYVALRFIAGFGLAGELGAAVSLVTESLPKEKRGLGTTLVCTFGLLGGVSASLVGQGLDWRSAYVAGGMIGFLLLLGRFKLEESVYYRAIENRSVTKGSFRVLFRSFQSTKKYLACILVGVPIYYCSGILITFSPEVATALELQGPVLASQAVLFSALGTAVGGIGFGLLSQKLRSRKKVIGICLGLCLFFFSADLLNFKGSVSSFYWICFFMGAGTGYWVVLLTLCAEQIGTNLRATVTTSVANFVRGSAIILVFLFGNFKKEWGIVPTALTLAVVVIGIAGVALTQLEETFLKEMDFVE